MCNTKSLHKKTGMIFNIEPVGSNPLTGYNPVSNDTPDVIVIGQQPVDITGFPMGGVPKILISGNISDGKQPLNGAHIYQVGNTSNGTTADFNGNFSLQVDAGSTVLIGYQGMENRTFQAQSVPAKVILSKSVNLLDPVVIKAPANPTVQASLPTTTDINWRKSGKIAGITLLTGTILYQIFKPQPQKISL